MEVELSELHSVDPASVDEPTDESKQELDADSAVLDGKVCVWGGGRWMSAERSQCTC